mgnify:CR=1 FL=1
MNFASNSWRNFSASTFAAAAAASASVQSRWVERRASPVNASGAVPATVPSVKLTSADRVMFPKSGITKGEIFKYYEQVAPVMARAP